MSAACRRRYSLQLNVPFQHKYGYIKDKKYRAIPIQWRKASDILTLTLAAFLFSSHPKKEKDWEARLNYYDSIYNMARQLSHHETKSNTTKTSMHP